MELFKIREKVEILLESTEIGENYNWKGTVRRKTEMKNYPLLQTQVGIFVECMKYPESTQYNLPSITMLTDDVDIERLERALCNIYIKRRELRLSFIIDKNGNPRQQVSEAKEFFVRKCKISYLIAL